MELLLNGRSVLGLPVNIPLPETFSCPVCMREKQPSLPHGPLDDPPLKVLGELLHMDFGFYRIRSCRGFTCFLVVTEAVSRHRWTFCRQTRTTPIRLILWIIQHLRVKTGVTVKRIRFDGELFGNNELKTELAKLHVIAEPTGAYNSAQNGKAEASIKLVGLVAQCLLYAAQLPSSMWCFAVSYATFLLNVRPSDLHGGKTPHEVFHKQIPNLSKAIFLGLHCMSRSAGPPDIAQNPTRYLGRSWVFKVHRTYINI